MPDAGQIAVVDLGNVGLVGPSGDLDGRRATQSQQLQTFEDVVREHLHREVGARAVAGAVVRRRHGEQVGEARYRSAAVGAGAVAPFLSQLLTVATADVDGRQEVQVITGGVDDDIEVYLPTIVGDNAFRVDLGRFAGLHVDVIPRQRRVIPTRVANDPLAVRREVRGDLLRQLGVFAERPLDVLQAHLQQHVVGR